MAKNNQPYKKYSRKGRRAGRNRRRSIIFLIIIILGISALISSNKKKSKNSDIVEQGIGLSVKQTDLQIETAEESTLILTKARTTYDENSHKTIVSLDIKNNGEKLVNHDIIIELYNENNEVIETTTAKIQSLNTGHQTRLNTIIEKDVSNSQKIKIKSTEETSNVEEV